jgi:serine/threonine protein kinase
MAVLCPSCGYEAPAAGPTAGLPCPNCTRKLIAIDPSKDDLIGHIVDDRFEVVAVLGQGGMGKVYRAVQRSIGREIALKVIDRSVENDVTAVKRFFREAQLTSKLSHPNTVSIIEFGQHADGRLYLAMELVRGQTLHEVVRACGALPPARVARIGVQLCDALEAAHAMSIIHRDLKLDNVMLVDGTRDHIKVLDFGLARSLVDVESRATSTGVVAGTPRYLAPEVATKATDPAPSQDLYAMGVILGELATGHELWKADTIVGLLAQKIEGRADLAGIPMGLAAIVESLLSNDPGLRPSPATIRDLLHRFEGAPGRALQAALGGGGGLVAVDEGPPLPSQLSLVSLSALENQAETARPVDAQPPSVSISMVPVEVVPPEDVVRGIATAPSLELETEWSRQRERKQQNAAAPVASRPGVVRHAATEPSRSSAITGVFVAVVVLGLCAAGGYVWWTHHKQPEGDSLRAQPGLGSAPNEVSIHIRGSADDVRVDGARVGRPPVTLTHARDGKTLVITAKFGAQEVTVPVVADHDAEVEPTPP